jgi:hypothetical protein
MAESTVDFWARRPLKEIATLAQLRGIVLQHNSKRYPKWKFKLADDLVMQIQPRPTRGRLFEGMALQGEHVTAEMFTRRLRSEDGMTELQFELTAATGATMSFFGFSWVFCPTRGVTFWVNQDREEQKERARRFVLRTFESLALLTQLDPSMMFQPACLNCGRPLTDPVSMARWIGPECATRVSFDARNRNLEAAQQAA